MKFEEIVKMTGNVEQAIYTLQIVGEAVTKEFIQSCINNKIKTTLEKIESLELQDAIYFVNGSYHVNWNPNIARDIQIDAQDTLYNYNRVRALISVK